MSLIRTTRKLLVASVNQGHRFIFGCEMGHYMRDFLWHLSWSIIGILISSLLVFAVNLLVGSKLGPQEYGNYNLVATIANTFIIMMFLGTDTTLVKFVSKSDNRDEQNSFLSNTLITYLLLAFLITVLVCIFHSGIAHIFKSDSKLVFLSLFLALIVGLRAQLDNFIKGVRKFKFQARMKLIESILLILLILATIFIIKVNNYYTFIWVSIVSALVVTIFYILKVKSRLRGWNQKIFRNSFSYLTVALRSALVWLIIGNIDKFFVSGFMGSKELGIYSAYLMSYNVLIIQLNFAIGNVFFPTVGRFKDKIRILNKVDQLCRVIFIPMVLGVSILTYMVMVLFGSEYEINYLYIVLVGIISFLQLVTVLYGSITASSHRLFKLTSWVFYFKTIFILFLYFVLFWFHWLNILSVFLILISSLLYDILNTKIAVIRFKKIYN